MVSDLLSCGMNTSFNSYESQRLFRENGPFYHINSKAVADVLFLNDEERNLAVLYLAISAIESNVIILAYHLMSNHIHAIVRGSGSREFYDAFAGKMNTYYKRHGRRDIRFPEVPSVVPINTLEQLRVEIVYVLRNQYAVDNSVNPFSYPWSSGFLYFNPVLERILDTLEYVDSGNMSQRQVRRITFTGNTSLPGGLKIIGGRVAPSSFVDYKFVERLFDNARSFMMAMFKKVEAQVETAVRLGEDPFLPDDELSGVIWKFCKTTWDVDGPRKTNPVQKRELAKHMKNVYHSSNGQIARITGLDKLVVDEMFPSPAKP